MDNEIHVCTACIGDEDLKGLLREMGVRRRCDFCGGTRAKAAPLSAVARFMKERMETFYGYAVDQLPYESREGGYQAWHVDTYDLLLDNIGLELPNDDKDELLMALIGEVGDETWCEYDWLRLEEDRSLVFSWHDFCRTIKHNRRFFFHHLRRLEEFDPDSCSALDLLHKVAEIAEEFSLIVDVAKGYRFYRARERKGKERHTTPASLGPPPPDAATQSNRMNPPGISMLYGASSKKIAKLEVASEAASIGVFEILRDARILDLTNIPPVPGFFTSADKRTILLLRFLHQFADLIVEPVTRDDRVHVDYIPTQVFTEFLRDHPFRKGRIDGIKYKSSKSDQGSNIVLFSGPEDVEGATEPSPYNDDPEPWLKLISHTHTRGRK